MLAVSFSCLYAVSNWLRTPSRNGFTVVLVRRSTSSVLEGGRAIFIYEDETFLGIGDELDAQTWIRLICAVENIKSARREINSVAATSSATTEETAILFYNDCPISFM